MFKGNEFKKGEKVLLGDFIVEVLEWTKPYGGWWYVRLPNGGFHYTRLITKTPQ